MPTTEPGVSIIICCFNSAKRLPQTLAHVAAQEVPAHIPWEVIVVDNASTDNTATLALELWLERNGVDFRVVRQPRPGLSYARETGFETAQFEYVAFVDDDNWICTNWVEQVYTTFQLDEKIGACGGRSIAAFEIPPPYWFSSHASRYAVGAQANQPGELTSERKSLWGAGLSIRKSAWLDIKHQGFDHLVPDRQGNKLTSGGDTEICYALTIAGWKLWYNPDLVLQHFLPASRLQWSYLRKLVRAIGASSVSLDPYIFLKYPTMGVVQGRFQTIWLWKIRALTSNLFKYSLIKLLLSPFAMYEGDQDIISIENHLGRLIELARLRRNYDRTIMKYFEKFQELHN